MGADLYMLRPSFQDHYDMLQPMYGAALAAKSELFRDYEAKHGKIEYENPEEWPRVPKDGELREAQEAVDKLHDMMHPDHLYFRDSYNVTCLAAKLGFSWIDDVNPLLDKDGVLTRRQCRRLANWIAPREVLPGRRENADTRFALQAAQVVLASKAMPQGGEPPKVHEFPVPPDDYFSEKRDKLVEFLRDGAHGEGIKCSL